MWECGGQHSAYIRDFQLIIDMVIYTDFFQVCFSLDNLMDLLWCMCGYVYERVIFNLRKICKLGSFCVLLEKI